MFRWLRINRRIWWFVFPLIIALVALAQVQRSSIQAQGNGPDLTVDLSTDRHIISPYIYGINFADEALAADLNLAVVRNGGNATSRYNWQLDVSNRGSDWYFENIPNYVTEPGNLPNDSAADQFIQGNVAAGAESLMTVPMIGWVPDSRTYADCGFSVARYGSQDDIDPWQPDCGNGLSGGGELSGNNPTDISVAVDETFASGWINHLTGQFDTAANGGVQFYSFDNEPMLWSHTHRDVHPDPVSYDEIRDRTYLYGAAIKAADPAALTVGPAVWGWTAYFYSDLDTSAGGAWWNNPLDRNAHGGTPFVEWYLQQMAAYESANGVRILDYLDLHYYPQNVGLSNAVDVSTRAMRLRSTRSLWDPTYIDESWVDTEIQLIPMMQGWVDSNYPGTQLAITEYNWGALNHINGALTQADVLGIFGRENLQLATLWSGPESNEPGAYAFRMYRNYDGQGSAFGEISLAASSSDQEQLSIYAARRTVDGIVTLMVVNKAEADLASTVSLTGLSGTPVDVSMYRYSDANLAVIENLAAPIVVNGSFSDTFPSNSITLVTITTAAPTAISLSSLQQVEAPIWLLSVVLGFPVFLTLLYLLWRYRPVGYQKQISRYELKPRQPHSKNRD